jgi:hypothetical protein
MRIDDTLSILRTNFISAEYPAANCGAGTFSGGGRFLAVHRYMFDIFEKPEFRFPSFASGARGPFRCAQEDYLKRFITRTTSFALSCRFCHARRRRAAFRQKRRRKEGQKRKVRSKGDRLSR